MTIQISLECLWGKVPQGIIETEHLEEKPGVEFGHVSKHLLSNLNLFVSFSNDKEDCCKVFEDKQSWALSTASFHLFSQRLYLN